MTHTETSVHEQDKIIDEFIRAIGEGFSGMNPKTSWPLNGGQMDSYFDVDESLDMYYRLNKLKETLTIKEIANLMPPADIIRIFLQHNAIIGLKVAKKYEITNISTEERIQFALLLFEILKYKVKNNIFCLDGKNLILHNYEIHEIIKSITWNIPNSKEEQKSIASLTISSNNLCYTLYYDDYMTGGFYFHGPYDVSKNFGEGAIMIIREYHNLNPIELWPELKIPYQKMRIYAIYKNSDIKINFVNHIITSESIGDKLIAYKVFLDDQEITAIKIEELIELFRNIASSQTKQINGLSDLDKVRKGAEISYYLFKKIREYMGDNWKPPIEIENTINKFGDQFIQQFKYKEIPDLTHWKKIFDPQDDYCDDYF